ncbi:MAG: phosphotransferase [Granulosicoccus sp.]
MNTRATTFSEHARRISALPCWEASVNVTTLEGGITNNNFLVKCLDSTYVVRLGEDIPEHQIMRFNEVAAGTAAYRAGISPAIRFHDKGVLVMDYIPGQALESENVRDTQTLSQIIELMRICHYDIPKHLRGASLVFWSFHIIRDYAATLVDGQSPHVKLIPSLVHMAEALEKAAAPFDIVFGHNDLLPANILNDGHRLWLIDWEYAGFNTPLFDLGGLASNNEFPESLEQLMLEQYFDKPASDDLWYRYQAMKCVSLLRETLWSMVSEIHSQVDFNYSQYSAENLARLEHSFDEFKRL